MPRPQAFAQCSVMDMRGLGQEMQFCGGEDREMQFCSCENPGRRAENNQSHVRFMRHASYLKDMVMLFQHFYNDLDG
jgi:hypothetical protein